MKRVCGPVAEMTALLSNCFSRTLVTMDLLTSDQIGRMTPPERLALIAQLWDSLGHDQLPVTPAQHAELDHRFASFHEDRQQGVTWVDLKAELTERCS